MYGNMREYQQDYHQGFCHGNARMDNTVRAVGLEALHGACREIYPDQSNPLTVTAVVKYWLGGPDPLDYISMYENPGCQELGILPHWHYISMGLSDLHGDNRLHQKAEGPGFPSGFGFELTFRLVREPGETVPPTWPANVMQQLAKYVFTSSNTLFPGDHVSWHAPLNNGDSKITQILMAKDPQMPNILPTPVGEVTFVQIVGVTNEELQAAQHWNGLGLINLLKTTKSCGPSLLTDMKRSYSVMDEDPTIAQKIKNGIEREGSNLSGVSAKCWWVQMTEDRSGEKYREKKGDSDDECETKSTIKSERTSPCGQEANASDLNETTSLPGLHLTFNSEAGSLLSLAIKGRVMHGRHFTFKSVLSHGAITFVAPSVTGTLVSKERPYVVSGPWLQVLIPEDLTQRMAEEFETLNNPELVQLPKTFSWPDHKITVTVIND